MTKTRCLALGFAFGLAACSSGPTGDVQPLMTTSVTWNPSNVSVGNVTTVVENENRLFLFTDLGAIVLDNGDTLAMDPTVRSWQGIATVIPAAVGSGTWAVATDADGQLWRLHSDMTLENVSGRYGLQNDAVRLVVAPGGPYVVFALADGLAISDGMNVTRYRYADLVPQGDAGAFDAGDLDVASMGDASTSADAGPISLPGVPFLAGAGGQVALAIDDAVYLFDVQMQTPLAYSLPGATMVAFEPVVAGDAMNSYRLVAATDRAVYVADDSGALQRVYDSGGPTIHGMATSGSNVWFTVGTELALLQGRSVAQTSSLHLVDGAVVNGSPSGDAWVVASGQLSRYSLGADQQQWLTTILPIFNRTCSACHLPGGTSGYDLSGYAQWVRLRSTIDLRVWTRRDMPPAGTDLSDSDRMAIHAWATSGADP